MSGKSAHPISDDDILWADLILVMEGGYKSWILGKFRNLTLPRMENLDIADEYEYMDAELVELIRRGVEYHIHVLLKTASRMEN